MKLPTTYTSIDGVFANDALDHSQAHRYAGSMTFYPNRRLQGEFVAYVKAWRATQHAGDNGAVVLDNDCVFYWLHPLFVAQCPYNDTTYWVVVSVALANVFANMVHVIRQVYRLDHAFDDRSA